MKTSLRKRQEDIKFVKDFFQTSLAKALNLLRVTAPILLRPETGLNDNLTGVEKAVAFKLQESGIGVEIVQSLAKWKRFALKRYGFERGHGLYTDMNAIRPFEQMDETHSIYVDQWDWELSLGAEERTEAKLHEVVQKIYRVFLDCEAALCARDAHYRPFLTPEIHFIDSQALLDRYPRLPAKAREDAICRELGAVFLQGIGGTLSDGQPHDTRSPDYDDWQLNGDILLWNPVLERAFELSSMGIRVDAQRLDAQLRLSGFEERRALPYHQMILSEQLPPCIGGGIGQSRICMLMLGARHIGEVQASVWSDDIVEACQRAGIFLL